MEPMLKRKEVALSGATIEVQELSAIDNLDYLSYIATLESPRDLEEGASPERIAANLRAWQRVNLLAHSRLVAYGLALSYGMLKLDDVQDRVLHSFNQADLKTLHDEVAVLSGFELSSGESSDKDVESESTESIVKK